MKQEQAQAIVEEVRRDFPGHLRATIEPSPKSKTGQVRVHLVLVAKQRRFRLRWPRQYPLALEAWAVFLPRRELLSS